MIDEKLNSSNNKSVNHRGNQYRQQIAWQNMDQLEFYMDVSPEWWIKSRKDESCIKKYICEKFEYDFYPRNISNDVKSMLLDKLKNGKFVYVIAQFWLIMTLTQA